MRGPIFGVFQNVRVLHDFASSMLIPHQAALMIFVLDTAIGLCIWIPFTIGKTTALLSVRTVKIILLR